MTTEATGIVQSDILIRGAVIAAIMDLRVNPYLLNYVFASLPQDALTAAVYGTDQVDKAKYWFLHTDIKVYLNLNLNSVSFPCVSIGLASSVEDETTLGDIHYQVYEDTDTDWPILAGPAAPSAYDKTTGTMTFSQGALGGLILAPGMLLIDAAGNQYPIEQVFDPLLQVGIRPGSSGNFEGLVIRPQRPAGVTAIESALYKETYSLGCHADSEPVHITYLHSIVVFALLRYKQLLLEGRGFERSSLSSTDLKRDGEILPDMLYSRYVQVTGYVRQAWPKATNPKITGIELELLASKVNPEPIKAPAISDAFGVVNITAAMDDPSTAGVPYTAYYGSAPIPAVLDETFVMDKLTSYPTVTRQAILLFETGTAQYAWAVIPGILSNTLDPSDFIDADLSQPAGFSLVGSVTVAGVPCNIWRSDASNFGDLSLIIS